MVLFSSAMFLMAMVSPLVEGPMMAKTFSSSMSCLAKEMAFFRACAPNPDDQFDLLAADAALGVQLLGQHLQGPCPRGAPRERCRSGHGPGSPPPDGIGRQGGRDESGDDH